MKQEKMLGGLEHALATKASAWAAVTKDNNQNQETIYARIIGYMQQILYKGESR